MNIEKFLKNVPIFSEIDAGHRVLLAKVAFEKHLKRRDILFLEGTHAGAVYINAGGTMQLHKGMSDGQESVVKIVQQGELFAEVVLFERKTYPVTAVALSPCTIIGLQRNDVLELLAQESFRNDFIAMLIRRQRFLAERIRMLGTRDVSERFRIFLRGQFGAFEQIECEMTRKDVAAAIDITPETLSRMLSRMNKASLLTWSGHTIRASKAFWQG